MAREETERIRASGGLTQAPFDGVGAVLANLRDVIWARESDGRSLVFLNPAAEAVYGRSLPEFQAKPNLWFDVVHPDDKARVVKAIESLAKQGAIEIEYRILRPNGEIRWLHERAHATQAGERRRVVGITCDVTDQHWMGRALQDTETRLRVIHSIAMGIRNRTSVDEIVRRTVELLAEAFPERRVSYSTIDPSGELHVLHSMAPEGLTSLTGERVDLRKTPQYLKSLTAREINVTPSIRDDERLGLLRELLLSGGAESMLDVPLRHSQDLVGLLCMCGSKPHRWTDSEITTVAEVGEFIGLAIADAFAREEREQVLDRLSESERLRRELMNVLPGMAYRCRADGTMELVSDGASELTGYSPAEWSADRAVTFETLVQPEDLPNIRAKRLEAFAKKQHFRAEYRILTKSGAIKWVWDQAHGVYVNDRVVAIAGFMTDITERKRLESDLVQSQKMESVGRLAGGIAHDFNNLLTAILGYSELARGTVGADKTSRQYLDLVTQAAQRANGMTQQLLSFARRQIVEPMILRVDELLLRLSPLLRRLLPESVELVVLAPGSVGNIRADRNQIEQVLVNLVANARDAMPKGGKVTIEADSVVLDRDEAGRRGALEPGPYVRIRVADTGVGIRPETQPFVFEPFFTTKDKGKGAGLGLATCFGIVKQHGGHISFRSEEGKGTTFEVTLPRAEGAPQPASEETPAQVSGGRETILVVEDEPLVRDMAVEGLRARGYSVLAAENGAHALQLVRQHFGPIDLLITDLVMPQIGGSELAELLEKARPGLRVLYTSGYTESFDVPKTMRAIGGTFLRKPYTPTILAQKVREVLD